MLQSEVPVEKSLHVVCDDISKVLDDGVVPRYPCSPEVVGSLRAVSGLKVDVDAASEHMKAIWVVSAGTPGLVEIAHCAVWCDFARPHEPYLWRLHGWAVAGASTVYRYDIAVRLHEDEGLTREALQALQSFMRPADVREPRQSLRSLPVPEGALARLAFSTLLDGHTTPR